MNFMKQMALLCWAVLAISSCKQQAQEMPQADFLLKLVKSDSVHGNSVVLTDHSLNVNGSAAAELKYVLKGNRIELRMGIVPGTNVETRLKAILSFKQTGNPLFAAGVYHFPEDSSRLSIVLTERTGSAVLTYNEILDGNVDVQYDPVRRTFSGTFSYLRFSPLPDKGFDRLNFSGWFNDALLEN